MKKSLVVAMILAFALMATAAMADIIDVRYNTSISTGFCPGGVTACIYDSVTNHTYETFTDSSTGDTITLNYYGQGNAGVSPTYVDALVGSTGTSGAQFGEFNITMTGNHGPLGLSSATGLLNGTQWNITINQVLPEIGTGTLSATLTGTISVTPLGQVNFTFATDNTVIGDVLYKTTSDSYGLNNSNGQMTSIDGTVATPEPASLALLGSGMLGLAGTLRRKLKA